MAEQTSTEKRLTALETAYYALDNKTRRAGGLTRRAAFSVLVQCFCNISNSTFYEWLKNPALIKKPMDKFIITLLLDVPSKNLFK